MKRTMIIASLLMLISCGNSNTVEKKDFIATNYDNDIEKYLEDKDWNFERQESGLYVYIEDEGSKDKPGLDSYLTLNYTGYLLDGTVFDGTDGEPTSFPFPVNRLVKGWQEGIPLFGKGGKGKLIVPPAIGYGSDGGGPIPPNAVLVFDIEIIDFSAEPKLPKQKDYNPEILAYIKEKGWDAQVTESGLYIVIEEEGGKEKPGLDSYLTLNYEGYFMDGNSFDGTKGEPTTFPFPMTQLIKGWQEGIPTFGKGGKGKLIVPPYLGYGANDRPGIPGNSILVFDIEIKDFNNGGQN